MHSLVGVERQVLIVAVNYSTRFKCLMSLLLTCLMAAQPALCAASQQAPAGLNIVIVEGDGAINNIRQRTAREPIVQVVDENNNPVAGATVAFLLPGSGPGASFPGGASALTVTTDQKGMAVAKGLLHNSQAGKFQIQVNASFKDLSASTNINQSNAALTTAGSSAGKIVALLAAAGGAAAAIILVVPKNDDPVNPNPPPGPTATIITAGSSSVGPPP